MADVPGDLTTNATIAVGTTITNAIETLGDHDWYKITLTAGQKVTIALNVVTLEDPYVYILNANGAVLAEADDGSGGRSSRLVFTAPTTGTYYIDAAAWVNDGSDPDYTGIGTYELSVSNYVLPGVGTLDQIANQMTHGFFGGDYHHFDVTQGGTITVNFQGITPAGRTVALQALQQWTDIIGINFVEVSGDAQISFDDLDQGTGAFANAIHSNHITSSAIVNVADYRINLHTYMHEIGHALGLGHTSNSNAGTVAAIYPNDALWSNDGSAISIMSYFDNGENAYYANQGFSNVAIKTPQVADIIAIGNLYGLSTTTRLGDTTYGFNNTSGRTAFDATLNPNVAYTIFDSGGIDTLDYSGFATNQLINLNAEAFSNVGPAVGNVVIARGTIIENAIGGQEADVIIGNAADNTVTGKGGADVLTGGSGNDTFRDTKGGLSGDTITDFGIGDKIVFTDATLSGFTFSLSGNTLSYTGGALTLGSSVSEIFASAAQGGGVQLQLFQAAAPDPASDFNGDGFSDVLWRNDAGAVVTFHGQSNGSFAGNVNFNLNPGLDWHVVGIGDFNGDGNDDILWRNDAGAVVDLLGQDNGAFVGNVRFNLNPGLDWHVEGTGDFNGDGFDDILWRNDIGNVVTLLGEAGGSFIGNVSFALNPGLDWHIEGTGDFNGDGYDDILWRNDIGNVVTLLGEAGGSFIGNVNFALNPGLDWHVIGTGDFNGDGYDDILWRSDTGAITDLLGTSNGAFVGNDVNLGNLNGNGGLAWQVAGIGDFNGDGIDDLMLRNDDGRTIDWLGQDNGAFTDNSGVFDFNPGTDWHVQPSSETLG